MKLREVRYTPEARDDLLGIYDQIATQTAPETAFAYVERLQDFCGRLSHGAERGAVRGDIRPGLRIIGFERRVTVAFIVGPEVVSILRLFYGGQDWEHRF